MSLLRVGVDCGGTNTDCVVVQGERIVAHCKSPTLRRVGAGVRRSLHTALQGLPSPRPPISHLMLGTTHFVNAMLQGVDLQRVAVLRLGGHATQSLPPLADWPPHLAHLVNGEGTPPSSRTHMYGPLLCGGVRIFLFFAKEFWMAVVPPGSCARTCI